MVASAVFITDLQGKAIISRNYRGDIPLNKVIERFANYLVEVEDEAKKPVFHVDTNGDVQSGEDVGATGAGGEHYVYVSVSTRCTYPPLKNISNRKFRLSAKKLVVGSHFELLVLIMIFNSNLSLFHMFSDRGFCRCDFVSHQYIFTT